MGRMRPARPCDREPSALGPRGRRGRGRWRRLRRCRRRGGSGVGSGSRSRCRRSRGCRGSRGRSRFRSGRRCRRRSRSSRGRRGRSSRQKRQRIDVVLAVAHADPEVEVRHIVLHLAGRAGFRDGSTLDHARPLLDEQRPKVGQRCLVAVARRDGDGEPVRRDGTRERHLSTSRCSNDMPTFDCDVDATMLATGVWVVADREGAQNSAVGGPGPRKRTRRPHERRQSGSHDARRCLLREHDGMVARSLLVVK
jgi:hypothetical protein